MNRISLTFVFLGIGAGAYAHHSGPPHYFMDQPQSLEGEVTELRLVNPHAYIYFDVMDDNGSVANWRCELSSATGLKRLGWTADSLVSGQPITVNGAPARREDNVCFVNFMLLEDGTRIARNGPPGGDGPASPATVAGAAAAADYEQPFDDPAIFCHPANIIFGWTHDRHANDIYQTDETVTLQYGYMDLVRTVHLDQSEHPDDIVSSVGGHSIGRWDGESVMQLSSEPYEPYACTELSGENNRRPVPE